MSLKNCRRFNHGAALLLDVDRSILARELAKFLFGTFQVRINRLKATLKKFALAPRRGSGDLCDESIQLLDVGLCHCRGTLRILIGNNDREYPAFAILRNRSVVSKFLACSLYQPNLVNLP